MGRIPNKTFIAIALLASSGSGFAATYAPWLVQMGVSDSILSAANWGKGQLLGVVDTGIVASNQAFASGQVSNALSSCAAVTFRCANGYLDDNGHGTAVASIAAGNKLLPFATYARSGSYGGYLVAANSVISVAPDANIVAEKVLNAQGSGYSTDVANGVRKAADAGAAVINVSISYGNSADIVSAINYAAAKGAFIVWAGGNDATALLRGANTNGLSAAAISHLVFAGSVNPLNVRSTFSDTPGGGALVNTSGVGTSYAARWVMAPGEAIVAPGISFGSTAWAYWTGTSMSTPLVSGSLLLLESAWPILKTNGTAANLLLATATDLGTRGVDATYGNGLVNLATAFQPYGTLTVTLSNGQSRAVSSLTGSLITSGALGNLSAVQSLLANYTAFDAYLRNFSVNLSGLIRSPASGATTNPLPTNVNIGPATIRFADGQEFSYWQSPPSPDPFNLSGVTNGLAGNQDQRTSYAMLTDRVGTTTALGYGFPVRFAYAKALYGNSDLAGLSDDLNVSNLSGLAEGGALFAYGKKINDATRIALSWSRTATVQAGTAAAWNQASVLPDASNLGVGITHRFNAMLTAGWTIGLLTENHGLLGSAYDAASPLSLGTMNKSYSLGFSAAVTLDPITDLLLESGIAATGGNSGNSAGNGFVSGTTSISSRSFGVSFMRKNVMKDDDRLTISARQPLAVTSGSVGIVVPTVDASGIAHFTTEWVSMAPARREIDCKLSYQRPLARNQSLGLLVQRRTDILNIAGNNDNSVGASWTMGF